MTKFTFTNISNDLTAQDVANILTQKGKSISPELKLKPISFLEPYYRDNLPQTNDLDGVLVKLPIYGNRYITLAPNDSIELNVENSIEIDFYDNIVSLFTTDTNYPIMDCKVEEEPGPTPPGPTPTTFTITYSNERVQNLNFNFTSESEEIPQELVNAFDNLGNAYDVEITCGEDDEAKTMTIHNMRIEDTYYATSDGEVIPCRIIFSGEDFANNFKLIAIQTNEDTESRVFTLSNNIGLEMNQSGDESSPTISSINAVENGIVILPIMNTDTMSYEAGPVTYSFSLTDDNNYDICKFVFGELFARTTISDFGGTIASSEDALGLELGKYYKINVNNGEDETAQVITKPVDGSLIGISEVWGLDDLKCISLAEFITGESNNTISFIDNAHIEDNVPVAGGSVLQVNAMFSDIYGPIDYNAPIHESFSATISSETTEVSADLNVVVGEFYSGTYNNGSETKQLIGLVGISDEEPTTKCIQFANITDGGYINTQYEGNNEDGLNIYIPEEGNITIERKGSNLGDGTFTLDDGVYPQNQS